MCQGFIHFVACLHHFVLAKSGTSVVSIRVKRGFCSEKEVTLYKHDQNDWHMSPLFGRTDRGGLIQLFPKEAFNL